MGRRLRGALVLCLGVAGVGCGGRAITHSDAEPESSGTAGSSTGGSRGLGTAGTSSIDQGGRLSDGGRPVEGGGPSTSTSGRPGGIGGNPNSPDGCSLTWWGGTLKGVQGLTTCEAFDHPAVLAYGQTVIPACYLYTGPFEQRVQGDAVGCRYHLDERRCGNDYQADFWFDLPVFGDGSRVVEVPPTLSRAGCSAAPGPQSTGSGALDKARQLTGVWQLCEGGGTQVGDSVVFFGDGSYAVLGTDAAGNVMPAGGCGRFGLWGFLPGTEQLNLYTNDGASFAQVTFFDGSPRRMRFVSGGDATYIAAE